MAATIERLFGLRRGEWGRSLLLFLYLFLIISTYVAGKATRDALFLERYSAVQLPYADMLVAVVVVALVAVYARSRRHLKLLTLLVGSLLFFSSNALALWWLGRGTSAPSWLPVVTYVWVGTLGVIGPAQVWTLANYVLTVREAKRLFGMIGSGAILGWVVGGLMTSTTATRFGARDVLLAIAFSLAACAVIVVGIWRKRPATMAEFYDATPTNGADAPRSLSDSVRMVWSSPYLRAVALVIGLSSLVTGVAAWQFKAIAKQYIPATNDLAAFFGTFNFYAGLLALVAQLLLTRRILRRFGVGVALFIVPISLMLGSIGLLVWGTLAAVVVLKGSDQVLRYSVDKSAVELLFLPVPPAQTFHAKLFIDGVIWRLGDVFSSAIILVAAGALGIAAVNVTGINLVLLVAWMVAAYVVYRQYVVNLTETIQQHRLDSERASAPVVDRSMGDLIASKLAANNPDDVLYGMGLLEVSQQRTTHPAVRALLRHPSAAVRSRAVAILCEARDASVRAIVEDLLHDEDLQVRTEALLYMTYIAHVDPLARIQEIGDFQDFSVRSAVVAFLAQPGETQNLEAASMILDTMVAERDAAGARTRMEAARIIGALPDRFERQLRQLLEDPDIEVARQAIRAVGRLCRRTYIDRVIGYLATPELTREASEVLSRCGDRIVGTLRDHLVDEEVPITVRREIPEILLHIGTMAARQALLEHLVCSDTILRFRIIGALNKLRQANPDEEIDTRIVETALVGEIMGHYRSYEILGTLGPWGKPDDPVTRGLKESMDQELERIFRLLQLLFPQQDIHSAYVGIQSRNPVVHDNALELLDTVLNPQLRNLLVPLLDSEVTIAERMDLANRILGNKLGSREEAIAALIYSEDRWLKACAAYSIGALGLKSMERELDRWLDDPDLLLRETARHSKSQLS